MTTVAIIQARMGASRLPGKVLMDLAGRPVLAWVSAAASDIPGVDKICVATSDGDGDDEIAEWCLEQNITCYRGPEDDVLARFALAAKGENTDVILRLTADCPLLDPAVCAQVLQLLKRNNADYASNVDPATWPDGLDCEAFTSAALYEAAAEAQRPSEREHVTPFIRNRRHRYTVRNLICPLPGLAVERWTLDTPEDLEFLRALCAKLAHHGHPPSFSETLAVLDSEPDLRKLNTGQIRNAGAQAGPAEEFDGSYRYTESEAMLTRAEAAIPLGAQTFSKSRITFPAGSSPLFLSHGEGGRVWDVDGNEYVDMVCGLLPVVLGYRDADVDQAICAQLGNGISFSLSTELESDLAERLIEIIPSAEKVRFGKNGTDATSAAIRLARAFSSRDRVAVCGYHGWQDWYIGSTTRNKGVPSAVSDLTHMVPYGDLDAVDTLMKKHPGEFAALILEPMTVFEPPEGYLGELKALVHSHGALLAFDEIITGFRYSLGGAQELFGVTPDLAAFGKAMGNGMPISTIVGRGDVMDEMEHVFYSGTFGGEALSLAAAIAVIDKMRSQPVIKKLWETGGALANGATARIAQHGLSDVIALNGKDAWKVLAFNDHANARKDAIKTLFFREMQARGVLIAASHNVCYAHDEADIARVLCAYDAVLPLVADELASGKLEERLGMSVNEPIFSVR